MIEQFGIRNFTCFKEGINLDFTFNNNVPESIRNNIGITQVLGIKGANGSGKTNVIKAIAFLFRFCSQSFSNKRNQEIDIDTYFRNKESSEFYIQFNFREDRYYYELTVNKDRVISESAYKISNNRIKLFDREGDKLSYWGKELKELSQIKLITNASIISQFNQFEFKEEMTDLKNMYDFFFFFISNVVSTGYMDINEGYQSISKHYYDAPEAFSFVKQIIKYADAGIKDIVIEKTKDEEGNDMYLPFFVHENNKKKHLLTYYDESEGSKVLFRKLYAYWVVLRGGGILALDEMDIHLHALVLPKIIELFLSPSNNPSNAQLIFTAHNTEILDTLGKYRTVLVNKEDNESYCYRLDEIPGLMIRNDRPITPLYLQGKIGGVPKIV